MLRMVIFCALWALAGSVAAADKLDAPQVQAGDSWTYRITEEKGSSGWSQVRMELAVTRATGSSIYFTVKHSGSTQAPRELFRGSDWSATRDVNGKETVVERPLVFPLAAGRSWKVNFMESNPPGKNFSTEAVEDEYRVVGYESIEVPAGRFQALKIEAEGHWTAQIAAGQTITQAAHSDGGGASAATRVQNTTPREVSGRLYKAFWYAPEVKRWVKSIEEDYSSSGVRNGRRTTELESFKPGS